MGYLPDTIDASKVEALVYHFPDGKRLHLKINALSQLAVLRLEVGKLIDTTHIDGTLHFFPRGNT